MREFLSYLGDGFFLVDWICISPENEAENIKLWWDDVWKVRQPT